MSRTIGTALAAHLAGNSHTRCNCLRLDLKDGTSLAITDHDADISFDLSDGAGSVAYSASTGILPSDLALATGFDASDIEVQGPITDTGLTTRAAFLGGRFDDAVAFLFQVNWADLTQGAIKLLRGYVAQASVEGGKFRLTIHAETSKFSQTIGRVISAYCNHDFGDAKCQAVPVTADATVSAVTDERQFVVTYSGTFADDFWNRGTVVFTSGALDGTRPVEIFDFVSGGDGTGTVKLWTGLAEAPAVGDTLTLKQGCEKTRTACMGFDNIVNFGGFPDVPGSDQVLAYPNPGS